MGGDGGDIVVYMHEEGEKVCARKSMTVLVVLTCCAGHTSRSGDLWIQDIHCRWCTDHRPQLAPSTAAEKSENTTRSKPSREFIYF